MCGSPESNATTSILTILGDHASSYGYFLDFVSAGQTLHGAGRITLLSCYFPSFLVCGAGRVPLLECRIDSDARPACTGIL